MHLCTLLDNRVPYRKRFELKNDPRQAFSAPKPLQVVDRSRRGVVLGANATVEGVHVATERGHYRSEKTISLGRDGEHHCTVLSAIGRWPVSVGMGLTDSQVLVGVQRGLGHNVRN